MLVGSLADCLGVYVSSLKSTQVEYESLKHEIQRFLEKEELLNSQLDEVKTLRVSIFDMRIG